VRISATSAPIFTTKLAITDNLCSQFYRSPSGASASAASSSARLRVTIARCSRIVLRISSISRASRSIRATSLSAFASNPAHSCDVATLQALSSGDPRVRRLIEMLCHNVPQPFQAQEPSGRAWALVTGSRRPHALAPCLTWSVLRRPRAGGRESTNQAVCAAVNLPRHISLSLCCAGPFRHVCHIRTDARNVGPKLRFRESRRSGQQP